MLLGYTSSENVIVKQNNFLSLLFTIYYFSLGFAEIVARRESAETSENSYDLPEETQICIEK